MDFLIYKYTQTMHENCKEMRNSPFHFATFIHLLFNNTGKQFKKCIYSQNYTTLDHMNILGLKNEHNQSKIAPSCFSHNEICLNQHLFLHVRLPWHLLLHFSLLTTTSFLFKYSSSVSVKVCESQPNTSHIRLTFKFLLEGILLVFRYFLIVF